MRSDETLIECPCGRRYMRTIVQRDQTQRSFQLCVCERKLGEWTGLQRYNFDPEDVGDLERYDTPTP